MFKSNGGFTLVELIVVIAILAILAGVAIPAYSGYIAKANDAACLSELSAIHTAAQAACAMEGKTLESITVSADGDIVVKPAAGTGETAYTAFYTPSGDLAKLMGNHSEYKTNGATFSASTGKWAPTAGNQGSASDPTT